MNGPFETTLPGASDAAQELFQEWLDGGRSEGDQEELLASHPAALQREVQGLIEAYERLRRELSSDPITTRAGQTLGDFRLVRELGRGGIGVVWEAHQISLDRLVALKLLSPVYTLSERSLDRFQREAEAGARLTHDGIVSVLQVGEEDGVHFIAQELVPGGLTLADRIAGWRAGDLPGDHPRRVAELFLEVAHALAHAHGRGVVHRDVKPSNILLTPSGAPRVADFGLAQVEGGLDLSRTGDTMGTPFYMSPEQARADHADARSDVFSLGVTLYEALTLTRPFEGDTVPQVLAKIRDHEPPDPRVLRSRIPRDVAVICMKALEKSRDRRYESMAALAEDLRRSLASEPILARPPGPWARCRKWSRRHPIVSTGGAIALVAMTIIVFLVFEYRSERDRSRRSERRAWQQNYLANISPAPLLLESASFRAAGSLLAACPEDQRGWEWRHTNLWLSRSELALEAAGHRITSVAFSPDGARFVSGSFDRSLRVWDSVSGKMLARLPDHSELPSAVVFSPDGQRIYAGSTHYFTGGRGGNVHVWEAQGFEKITTWRSLDRGVDCMDLSQDGRWLACGGEAGLRVLDTESGICVLDVAEGTGHVTCVAFDPTGERVLTGAEDSFVRLWDRASGRELLALGPCRSTPSAVAFDPVDRRILAGTVDGSVHLWSEGSAPQGDLYLEHTGRISSLQLDVQRRRAISTSEDGTVRIWDLDGRPTGERIDETRGETRWDDADLLWRTGQVTAASYDSANQRVLFGAVDGALRVVDASRDEPVAVLRDQGSPLTCVAFHPQGDRIATGSESGSVWIWDAWSGEPERVLLSGGARVLSLSYGDSDGVLVVETASGALRRFTGDGEELRTLPGEPHPVPCTALSPDGRWIARTTGSAGFLVQQVEGEDQLGPFRSGEALLTALAFDAAGTRLVATTARGELQLWDTTPWTLIDSAQPSVAYITCVAIDPAGRVAYGSGRTIRVWDTVQGKHLTWGEHAGMVTALRFSPDGTRLWSAGVDERIVVWNTSTGDALIRLTGHEGRVEGLAVSPDGERLASVGSDGSLRLWESDEAQTRRMGEASARRRMER